MFKVLVWDHTGVSAKWFDRFADNDYIDIVATLTPESPDELTSEILLKRDAWDWLLIFEQGTRKFFDEALTQLNLPLDRVIYALDIGSWLEHPKASFALILPIRGGVIYSPLNFEISRQLNDYVACTVEGLSYVATSKDNVIMPTMHNRRVNWVANDMKIFHTLAKKYYNVDDSAGYFLDLGANIGTTGIYFIKKLAPKLKLLSFEPDPENFKMHRVNLILNDLDDRATLVNCGLGNTFDTLTMYRNLENPGSSGIFANLDNDSRPTETIKIIPLDSYLAENNIAAQSVKYIWIDTEGFELQVLLGAKNLLAENPAPIFAECNLKIWKQSEFFGEMMHLLSKYYSHFLLFESNNLTLYSLDSLWTLEPGENVYGTLGDIMLIKAGLIS